MRRTTILIGVFAFLFVGSAAIGMYLLHLQSADDAADASSTIVVAATDIPRGVSVTPEMVRLQAWPLDFIPPGALIRIDDAVGRAVGIPMVKGDPLTEPKLSAMGAGRGMAALIPAGMRAMTILTPNVSTGMAGFVLPGDKVDVLLTYTQPMQKDGSGGGGTLTLLQHVEVMAVDQRIEVPSANVMDQKELRSVTLLVTPQDGAKLDLGQNMGTLSLALRNPSDQTPVDLPPVTLAGLYLQQLGGGTVYPADMAVTQFVSLDKEAEVDAEPAVAAPRPLPRPPPIRTLRGSTSGQVHLHGVSVEDDVE